MNLSERYANSIKTLAQSLHAGVGMSEQQWSATALDLYPAGASKDLGLAGAGRKDRATRRCIDQRERIS